MATRARVSVRVGCAVLAALMAFAALLAVPGKARAVGADDIPEKIYGTCYIGETWMVGDQSFFTVPSFSGGLAGAVPSTTFECINHTAAAPEHVEAEYEATLCGLSIEEGWVEYDVVVTPPDATDGVTSNQYGLIGYQRVAGKVRLTWEFEGDLELVKSSARPQLTDGNPCYSLAGAVYDVFAARGDDGALSGKVGELVTDAWGKSNTLKLKAGTYFVREAVAPEGYLADGEVHVVSVEADKLAVVYASDMPVNDPTGMLVQKVDAAMGEPVPVGNASLAGAEVTFRYYAGHYGEDDLPAVATRTWVMRTDDNGLANIIYDDGFFVAGDDFYVDDAGNHILPLGTITATETKAPEGYLLGTPKTFITQIRYDASSESGVVRVKVNYEGVAVSGNVADAARIDEQPRRGNVEVVKRDVETADGAAQGDATLAGAVFDIVNESEGPVVSPQTGQKVAPGDVVCQIVTDEGGFASTARADLNGWAVPDGWDCKALGFGKYSVVESKAPEGYELNVDWRETVTIGEDGEAVRFEMSDPVVRGGVMAGKVDRGNGMYLPEGASTLAGAVFEVVNRGEADVMVGGVSYAPGKVVATIEAVGTGAGYVASTDRDALPYSTYELREVAAPEGYLVGDELRPWSRVFSVRGHEMVDLTESADAAADQVIRGDIFFNKVHEATMARLAGVPFKVTSQTTGEWHVVVTDENGQVATGAGWNSHLSKTNANDAALRADGSVDESKLDLRAGVWFHGRADVQSAVDDALGALPYDTYTVTELKCSANEGLVPVEFEVTVSRHARELDLGTVDDREEPRIGTELTGLDGIHVVPAAGEAVLVDKVSYSGLPAGGYTVEGELHLVGADGSDEGAVVRASKGFEAAPGAGSVEVRFTVDTSGLGGRTLVAFERVVGSDGKVVASHEDLNDEGQTVAVPEIGTTLVDEADGDHEASSVGAVTLVDTVAYQGLAPYAVYEMAATLHLKGENGEDLGVAHDADGNPIVSRQAFTPTEPDGTVEVTFTFVPADEGGMTVVAFEELRHAGRVYSVHADIADKAQAVDVPRIGTTAGDPESGHVGRSGGKLRIVDTVAYEKLQAGAEYGLVGELHVRDANGNDLGVAMDAAGNPVKASATVVPDASSGTVELVFEAEVDSLPGSTYAVFETLTRGGRAVAVHADITDEGQTVHYPEIGTTATDADNGTHTAANDRKVTVSDMVVYSNLVPGIEYTVRGTLHLKADDGLDGDELLGADGKAVSAVTTFTPEQPDGAVELRFDVDGSLLAGKTVVAFESMRVDGVEVAVHADIDDGGQSVSFPAELHTTAMSPDTESQTLPLGEKVVVVDTVAYRNLVPGETYVVSGALHVRGSDGSDAGVYGDGGKAAAPSARFMPETPDGTVEIAFEVDTRDLAGAELVAFEELLTVGGAHIASHADISDEGQTVSVPSIGTTAVDKASGGHSGTAAPKVTIVDEVAYEGLSAGHAYRVEGTLIDKGTGRPYEVSGKQVTASAEFTAEASSGRVAVEFEFDGSALSGATLVAFERMYDAGGALVAAHEDVGDEGQTVSYGAPESSIVTKVTQNAVKFYDRTADWLMDHWPVLVVALVLIGAGAAVLVRKRRHVDSGDEVVSGE